MLGFSPLFNLRYQAVIAAEFRVWAALLSITLLLVSCAGKPGADKRAVEEDIETILRQPLEKSEYAEAKRCLGVRDYDDSASSMTSTFFSRADAESSGSTRYQPAVPNCGTLWSCG